MTALQALHGTVAIDGVERRPNLFPILRALVDREPLPAGILPEQQRAAHNTVNVLLTIMNILKRSLPAMWLRNCVPAGSKTLVVGSTNGSTNVFYSGLPISSHALNIESASGNT